MKLLLIMLLAAAAGCSRARVYVHPGHPDEPDVRRQAKDLQKQGKAVEAAEVDRQAEMLERKSTEDWQKVYDATVYKQDSSTPIGGDRNTGINKKR